MKLLIDEIRAKSDEELLDIYEDLKEELYTLRINYNSGELVDTSEFSKTKKTVARVLTVLRERELAAEVAEGKN